MKSCPVCGAGARPLLRLDRQPIYQHPVPEGVDVAPPHSVDLRWVTCEQCAHAWQPDFDADLLASIYRNYYYTPAPDGIAIQFRDDFLAAMADFGLLAGVRAMLEVGCSSGELLAELARRAGARAHAFEPNVDNARVASARGLDVREQFFGASAAGSGIDGVDLLFARHVIEHIFDFPDFFAGVRAVCAPGACLVLETPSLDFHAERGTIDPFHIEHIHVFALRSLARLASAHGFGLRHSRVTSSGNLIAAFRQGAPAAEVPRPVLDRLQATVDGRQTHLRTLLGARSLVFWGAGSCGVGLATSLGREPEVWTDGNPAKVGKHFAGLQSRVVGPAAAFAAAAGRLANPALVITSSFVAEILPRVRELGWRGDIFDAAGNQLQ
jgi:SAM-dependent methyltransferase